MSKGETETAARFKVAVGVMTCTSRENYSAELRSCLDTWAPECSSLGIPVVFFDGEAGSGDWDFPGDSLLRLVRLPGVGQDYASASDKQWLGFHCLYAETPADFYMIIGTDNYVWGENLLKLLRSYDPSLPWAISGFQQCRVFGEGEGAAQNARYWCFPLGGAGVILSREALRLMEKDMPNFTRQWREQSPPQLADASDVAFAFFAEKYRVPQVRDYPLYACSWLYRYKNPDYINVGEIDYEKAAVFHYMEDRDMRLYHSLRSCVVDFIRLRNCVARSQMETKNAFLSHLYKQGLQADEIAAVGLGGDEAAALALGLVERKALRGRETVKPAVLRLESGSLSLIPSLTSLAPFLRLEPCVTSACALLVKEGGVLKSVSAGAWTLEV